jgi:hypothetical protein
VNNAGTRFAAWRVVTARCDRLRGAARTFLGRGLSTQCRVRTQSAPRARRSPTNAARRWLQGMTWARKDRVSR